jgi:hypothetical protein
VDAWKSALEREKHASFMDYIRTMWPGFVAAIQMTLTVVKVELTLTTAGGRIVCRRCNAMSKRTKLQCGGPAMKGKTKCKFHGGKSTGPVTELGRQICAAAKTVHGNDTRADRQIHRLAMMRLRLYAQILGVPFRSDAGDKRLKYLR